MRKILKFLFLSIILLLSSLSFILPSTKPAYAANNTDTACNGSGTASAYKQGTYSSTTGTGTPADDTDTVIQLVIDTSNSVNSLVPNGGYNMSLSDTPDQTFNKFSVVAPISDNGIAKGRYNPDTNGRFVLNNMDSIGETDLTSPSTQGTFKAGTKYLDIFEEINGNQSTQSVCNVSFNIGVSNTGPDNYCTIQITSNTSDQLTTNSLIGFKVIFPGRSDPTNNDPDLQDAANHRVLVTNTDSGERYPGLQANTNDLEVGQNIPYPLSSGKYNIEVWQYANASNFFWQNEGKHCTSGPITVDTLANGGGYLGCKVDTDCGTHNPACTNQDNCLCLPEIKGSSISVVGSPVCRTPSDEEGRNPCVSTGNNTYDCQTAIGAIGTSASDFAKSMLQLFFAIAGVILLFILILNGYRFITSQGDPEKVKEARESITSAIAGLIVVALAIVILQFITVTVLGLPGFK